MFNNVYNELSAGQKAVVKCIFMLGILCVALLLLAGAAYYGFRAAQQYESVRDTGTFQLSVSGNGTVYVLPDVATVSLTVKTQAANLKNASNNNNQKNNQLVVFLKSKGIDAKDIKTTYYNVTPQYQSDTRPCALEAPTPSSGSGTSAPSSGGLSIFSFPCRTQGPPKIVGYEVSNSIEVKVRNLDGIGAVLDGAVSAGANEVGGPVFTVDNEDKAKEEARTLALAAAKYKAETLARSMGVRLIKISGFSESGGGPIYYGLSKNAVAEGASAAPTPDIQPGQNEIKVTVTVTYDAK